MKTQRGYTLIETLVAMLILVMLSASGLYGWQYWQQSQRLWQTASQARDYLLYLREDANWHNRDHSISVIREGTLWCLVSSVAGANTCHGSSPLVFVPRWPEVEMSDLTPSLAFFGLRNTAWAGHIRFKKLNGRVVAGGFAVGKTPALSARRNRRMPVKEQGFSLLEVLIAMAISSVLLLGAARFLPALQRESLTGTRKLALEDEIWLRVFTVAKHLQRAGYCHGSCTGEGLEIVGQGDCIIVQWDANSNGIWDREPVKESDQIGFRLKEHVLETLRGATSCEGKGWDKVTNPDAIIIDTFQVVRQDVSGFSPVLTVNMRAASKSEPQTVVDASYSVTGFNL